MATIEFDTTNGIRDFSPNDARPCDVDGRFDVGTFNGRAWPRAMVSAAVREMGRRHALEVQS